MSIPQLDLIGTVVEDMAPLAAFYGRLGLDVPAEAENQPYGEVTLADGVRLAWDALETVR
jgi:hypothetical protein